MATASHGVENVYQGALVNYLISMARQVEGAVNRSIEALLVVGEKPDVASGLASEIFLNEPRVNEMEIIIDEHAVKLLRGAAGRLQPSSLSDGDIRLIVATIRVNNDLERMGDLAVNIGQRVVSLAQMERFATPEEIAPMSAAVRAMVTKSLGALIYRNVDLANEVLSSDDLVDHYRDMVCERLLAQMTRNPVEVPPNVQFILASRYLERIADHATNIAEDIVYWVRGLDVRHGRGLDGPAPALGSIEQSLAGLEDHSQV